MSTSRDSIELRNSPAPTYTSAMDSHLWAPSSGNTSYASNNPYHQPKLAEQKSTSTDQEHKGHDMVDPEKAPVKPDYEDPNHPHFARPSSQPSYNARTPYSTRRWLPKRVLIPWALAILFFLTTLWFTSIALGVRFFSVLQPIPRYPTVQEIHIHMDNDQTAIVTSTFAPSPTQTSSASTTLQTPSAIVNPTPTGPPNRAPNGAPPFEWVTDSADTILARSLAGVDLKTTGFATLISSAH